MENCYQRHPHKSLVWSGGILIIKPDKRQRRRRYGAGSIHRWDDGLFYSFVLGGCYHGDTHSQPLVRHIWDVSECSKMTSSYFQSEHLQTLSTKKALNWICIWWHVLLGNLQYELTYMSNNGSPTKEALNKTEARNIWSFIVTMVPVVTNQLEPLLLNNIFLGWCLSPDGHLD